MVKQMANAKSEHADHKPVYIPAAIASAVVFGLYLMTLTSQRTVMGISVVTLGKASRSTPLAMNIRRT